MEIFINPEQSRWDELSSRPASSNPAVREAVVKILERVKAGGDDALRELSLEIDRRPLGEIEVSREEILGAEEKVKPEVKEAIGRALENIRAFHSAQKSAGVDIETAPGVRCIQKPVPIERVGLYIPGGTAPLFSTVLMLAIPAKIAGCGLVELCTPCGKDGAICPEVLYAASVCGVDRVFRIGGAQSIAAMAYGTRSVCRVDKIFGPGNQWVTTAKQLLSAGTVAIDMPAGPSEVMVLADSKGADPAFVASDLLSQAEHGADSQAMLVCDRADFADKVLKQLEIQKASLPREEYVEKSLSKSRCVVFNSEEQMAAFANHYAPEHLIVSTSDPWGMTERITTAGSVFVGNYTPESAGDYASGTNHTLPTCGWAHSFSGVNLDSFTRKMTIQHISREGLEGLAGTIVAMADAEGLSAHAGAVLIRTKNHDTL